MRSGHTLVELIVVLMVVCLLLGLIVPAFLKPAAHQQLLYATAMVREAIAQTRLEAIESGQPHIFHIEPGGQSFSIENENDEVIETEMLPGDATFATTSPEKIRFEVTGRTASDTICLLQEGEEVEIVVRGLCGDTQIQINHGNAESTTSINGRSSVTN